MMIIMGAEQQVSSRNQSKWRTVGIIVKEDDLFILNQKLELNGFKTLNEFVHAWIKGDYLLMRIMSRKTVTLKTL